MKDTGREREKRRGERGESEEIPLGKGSRLGSWLRAGAKHYLFLLLGQGVVGVAVLPGHGVIVYRLQMVLEFVGPRELPTADQARKHLTLVTFVVEVGVPLKTVLVLKGPCYVLLLAGQAPIHSFLRDGSVAEQVQPTDRHLLQLLRVAAVPIVVMMMVMPAARIAQQSPIRSGRIPLTRRTGQVVQRVRASAQQMSTAARTAATPIQRPGIAPIASRPASRSFASFPYDKQKVETVKKSDYKIEKGR